jgi:uncharacterized protein DUF2844
MKELFLAVAILLWSNVPAGANLGGPESSVAADQQILRGQSRQEARGSYKVYQISAANGVVWKEFVSPAGMVFAISWQGPHMPNLERMLGSSLVDLQVAMQSSAPRRTRGPLIIRTDKLVLVSGGHMRAFHGYAYVPGLVPANVSPETLQ